MGRQMATKLKVYKGDKHPHFAQQPQPLEFHASNAPKQSNANNASKAIHALEG
jgi:large subunit ribosomal protein L13